MKTDENSITWKGDDNALRYQPGEIKQALWCKVGARFQIRFVLEGGSTVRFDGFRRSDYDVLAPFLKEKFSVDVEDEKLGADGVNWGSTDFEGPEGDENLVVKDVKGNRLFELGLNELSQCAFPSKNEVELQFVEEDTTKTTEESLVSLSFFVPQGDEEERDLKENTAAYRLQQMILERAGLINNNGNMITEINSQIGKFMTPRGRYSMEFYDNYMRMNGNNYTYKILYKTISCIYLFDQPDIMNKALVFCLTKPLRQGQQTYPHLVLYAPTDTTTITLNLDESVLAERYNGKLQPTMSDEAYKLIAKLFKFIGGVKLYTSDNFHTSRGAPYVRCVHKSEGGLLYFMERTLFFIHKPTLQIAYDDIQSVHYHRYDPNSHTGNKMFDIQIKLKGQNGVSIWFHNIEYPDFSAVNAKLASKDIRQLGLHHLSQQVFESDSDDEDFDDNSAANQESEDRDYQGGGENDEASETSEEMKELVPESDMEVEEASDHEASNPSKRQKTEE